VKLYVLGLGPGDPELVTVKASKILGKVSLVFVPYSTGTNRSLVMEVVSPYINQGTIVRYIGFPMGKEVEIEALREIGKSMMEDLKLHGEGAFVTLGDPTLYSTYFRVEQFLEGVEVELIPGVTSMTACASKLGVSLAQGDQSILITPAGRVELVEKLRDLVDTFVILKGNQKLDQIASILQDFHLYYARRCGMKEESLGEWNGVYHMDYFSMLIGVRRRDR
jgi:precorrin-2/cobalt-factor-2 C20-methyltransferase